MNSQNNKTTCADLWVENPPRDHATISPEIAPTIDATFQEQKQSGRRRRWDAGFARSTPRDAEIFDLLARIGGHASAWLLREIAAQFSQHNTDRLAATSWRKLARRWETQGLIRRETNKLASGTLAVLREQIVLTSTGWRFTGREGSVSRIPITNPRHLHEIQRAATRLLTNHPVDADWVTEARVRSLLARRRAELDRRGLGKDRQDHIPDGVLVRTGKQRQRWYGVEVELTQKTHDEYQHIFRTVEHMFRRAAVTGEIPWAGWTWYAPSPLDHTLTRQLQQAGLSIENRDRIEIRPRELDTLTRMPGAPLLLKRGRC